MSDHGTKVQCPKCNEWVSGSHNCDIYEAPCGGFNLGVEEVKMYWSECTDGSVMYYRPLTCDEVEDVYVHTQRDGYKLFNRCDKNYLISQLGGVLITYWYKGASVKLLPREG